MSDTQAPQSELKRLFAIGMLKTPIKKPTDAYDIATSIFGSDTVAAMMAGANWPTDVEVLRIRDELLAEHGPQFFLPSKEEFALKCIAAADEKINGMLHVHDGKTRAQLLRLAAEVMGLIDRPAPAGKSARAAPPPDIEFAPYPDQLPASK